MTVKPAKKAKKSPRRNYSAQCDTVFSKLIRARGFCEAAGTDDHPCKGVHQCAHGIPRTYRAVRWDSRNAFCLCAGHHLWYTHHPIQWDYWLHAKWGTVDYLILRALALSGAKVDVKELLPVLKERLRSTT